MARISFSYLCPASWYFTVPTVSPFLRQRVAFLGLFFISCLLLLMLIIDFRHWSASLPRDRQYERYLARVGELEATDTEDPNLNYGLVVDCGSSGSRIFVYFWPRHNGNPHDLLDIKQMRDRNSQPVVKKIKPGISAMADTPEHASDYLRPLLSFAAAHVPVKKHKETPLYILCTAGMRLLPERKQLAILADLVKDLPLEFDFLFSQSQAEVISGKQEGVYAWIGINFVLGRFDHEDESDAEATQELAAGRRRTVGILDMGGASLQIAYEVPTSTSVLPAKQEEAAKILLAEFNLGCDVQHTEHVYRVYVTTFLGFGGNFARQRYEDLVLNETLNKNRLLGQKTGLSPDNPFLDPCLPVGLTDVVERNSQVLHVRGRGDWVSCGAMLNPLLARSNTSQASLNGIYQSPIDFNNSEFYGFSEFFYCTEDVLRIGGRYHGPTFAKAAQDYCGMAWSVLTQRFKNGLFSSHADEHRLKYQCFKSAWMYQVLHEGFHFPYDYPNLRTAQLVYDREVQWTLGAILYKTRFLPLRDLRQEGVRQAHGSWFRLSFVYNHYLFFACILVVLLAIVLYLLRLRRIHHRETRASAPLDLLWLEEVVPMMGVQVGP
ncbi:ectonucleoside triphosphate diphosphohydrolase 7 [Nomascus leucogenys]|uniref:nucleoside-triphosphate phosphatase n=1 Tax=Nomascus leucogenys TaxID=61853 RepID=A0A2I3HI29_NOMLE|nr:ectonucleoside triphosphate diphosphohydrolase 7 [Nomascus leucogenys]XP_032036386.1 ectonucleoside triphosphate diphosphohydrolase 7 [Hylobates moloch]XP_055108403.1 ectonucleoside triphosphate diphosphohydrolase 7 isoform X1 [Symphalangus syndactylus]